MAEPQDVDQHLTKNGLRVTECHPMLHQVLQQLQLRLIHLIFDVGRGANHDLLTQQSEYVGINDRHKQTKQTVFGIRQQSRSVGEITGDDGPTSAAAVAASCPSSIDLCAKQSCRNLVMTLRSCKAKKQDQVGARK